MDEDLEKLWEKGIEEAKNTFTKGLIKSWEQKVADVKDGYLDDALVVLKQDGFPTEGNPEWDAVLSGDYVPCGSDEVLKFASNKFTAVQEIVSQGKVATLQSPIKAGTRVLAAVGLGAMLTYPDLPDSHVAGTVVTVRTGSGDSTEQDGQVFVTWDDGEFRPMYAQHLKLAPSTLKQASAVRIVTSSLGDLSGFFESASSGGDLVHKATKDLWSLKKDGSDYVIERLFTDTGKPLKV